MSIDYKELTAEELEDLQDQLVSEMNSIKEQLETVKVTARVDNEYADPEWYRSANHALRSKQQSHQRVLREWGRRKRVIKDQNRLSVNSLFVQIAKEQLDPEEFAEWMEEANSIHRGNSPELSSPQ